MTLDDVVANDSRVTGLVLRFHAVLLLDHCEVGHVHRLDLKSILGEVIHPLLAASTLRGLVDLYGDRLSACRALGSPNARRTRVRGLLRPGRDSSCRWSRIRRSRICSIAGAGHHERGKSGGD